ncbi:MBL fold metallo-hydrolase [Acidianus sulfidivorans JP7]|uniref:MBL fold metallo-hydrolase n=1 Tax=Acidianus sulfidivorans JP7 TaxID=619593 RepID=A0A2U9IJF1_9CREN|nr:MBL fold metallo-hydrolase [Acidianus sulfidivorans]AWR96105.1 MBL fold metallo-hydrolase [Acidianus sulfidivorans JP7]
MLEKSLGDLKIKLLQGYNEIGGNCILIEDKDNKIIFDQGIRFSRFRKFFGSRIEPTSPSELKELGIIPPSDEFPTIYISHYHLDHLGLTFHLSQQTIYVPDIESFNAFVENYKLSGNWTTYIPPSTVTNVNDSRANNDNVIPIPVEHSAYPAVAYYYNHPEYKILYSGDFRITSPLEAVNPQLHKKIHETTLLEEIERKGYDVDLFIVEGTNFSSSSSPLDEFNFANTIMNIFDAHENSLIYVLVDPLDIEAIFTILYKAKEKQRSPIITTKRLMKMVNHWRKIMNLNDSLLQMQDENEILMDQIVTDDEIKSSPSSYIILTSKDEAINIMRKKKFQEGSVVISLSTEAKSESNEDESIEDTWFKYLGVISYRLRISGHYYPYELKIILDHIRPKYVLPIHTESPRSVCEFVSKLGYNCL